MQVVFYHGEIMKKKVLLCVLASAMLLGTAFAEVPEGNTNVKFYGTIDQSVFAVNDGFGTQSGIDSLANKTTHVGIIGTENLGSGLTSGFNLETQILMSNGAVGSSGTGASQTTTGTSEIFNRAANMFIGSKDAGEFRLGRMVTPISGTFMKYDALGMNSLGLAAYWNAGLVNYGTNKLTGIDGKGTIGGTNAAQTEPGYFANGVSYTTPTVYHTTASFFTSPGANNSNAIREMLVSHEQGPVQLAAGVGQLSDTSGNYVLTRNMVGATYTLGNWKFSGTQIGLIFDNPTLGHNVQIRNAGVKYAVNDRLWVGTEYTTAQDTVNKVNSSKTLGLATEYSFSKHTAIYAIAGRAMNGGAAAIGPIYSTGATFVAGRSVNGVASGIKYVF